MPPNAEDLGLRVLGQALLRAISPHTGSALATLASAVHVPAARAQAELEQMGRGGFVSHVGGVWVTTVAGTVARRWMRAARHRGRWTAHMYEQTRRNKFVASAD